MTHHDVINFEKLRLNKNQKTNNCKKKIEIPSNPAKDINLTRFTHPNQAEDNPSFDYFDVLP